MISATVLASAFVLAQKGDITGALQQNAMALKEYPSRLSDQALFQRGLLLAHPGHPQQNDKEAARIFQKLMTDFPNSELNFDAGIWLKTLERLLQKKQTIEELEKELTAQIEITTHLKEQNAIQRLKIDEFIEQVAQLEGQISQLEGQIEKLKKVDLGIELEKRKTVSQ